MILIETTLSDQKLPVLIHIQGHRKLQPKLLLFHHVLKELPIWVVHGDAVLVPFCDQDVTIRIHTNSSWNVEVRNREEVVSCDAENFHLTITTVRYDNLVIFIHSHEVRVGHILVSEEAIEEAGHERPISLVDVDVAFL